MRKRTSSKKDERETGMIIGKLDSIHEDVSEIKISLKELNGKVQTNTLNIKTLETVYKTDSKWVAKIAAITGGIASIIVTIVGWIIRK
uniref:Uncharacterized protein n=1 Tax=viral metagenome TaxID=1070528 RepID=A0A6M3M394_9ZZZZ